jgi:hypothetical protein
MGMVTEHLLSDVSDALRVGDKEGVKLMVTEVLEDYRSLQRLVVSFPAAPVNGLSGYFLLSLQPQSQGSVWFQQAGLYRSGSRHYARVHVKSETQVEGRWAYSRRPETQPVALAAFDDPYEIFEAERFRRSEYPDSLPASFQLAASTEWTWQEIELPSQLIKTSVSLDHCEVLLDRMDLKFRREGDGPLCWQEELVTMEELERAAAESEMDATGGEQRFNILLEYGNRELILGKRIQPIVRYPVTLIGVEGTPITGTVGCSVAR